MSVFDDMPQLNETPRLLQSSQQMPTTLPKPQMTQVPEPKAPSGLKEKAIGALKGVGSTIFDTGKQVAQQAGTFARSVTPFGLKAPGLDTLPGVQGIAQKAQQLVTPSNTAQQRGFDVEQTAELFTPIATLGVGAIAKAPDFARRLEELSLRLTPAQKRDLGAKLKGATDWLVENGISGSPEKRLEKVDAIYDTMERKVANFFKQHADTSKYFINKEDFIQRLHMLKASPSVVNSRDYNDLVRQLDGAIDNVKSAFRGSKISLPDFNNYKRSIFSGAYNKAGTKISDELEYEIGDAAYEMLEQALMNSPVKIGGMSIREFNRTYSNAITARKLLKEAVGRNEVGFFGKLAGMAMTGGVGAALGGPAGMLAAGFGPSITPMIAGTAVRSNVGQMAESIAGLSAPARKALGALLLGTGALSVSTLEGLLNQSGEETPPSGGSEGMPPQVSPEELQTLEEFKIR
jgi:hypothetical protein